MGGNRQAPERSSRTVPEKRRLLVHGDWYLWNALFLGFGLGDIVNGQGWTGGYTGTMRDHGLPVQHEANLLRGDLVHYGPDPGLHVTMVVGRVGGVPMVVSHGSEDCPCYTNFDYRHDDAEFRRYI